MHLLNVLEARGTAEDVDRALSLYKKALELEPARPTLLYNLGRLLQDKKDDLAQAS
jgi:hypothetical protein